MELLIKEKCVDNDEKVGVIFMDLSKAFDTINQSQFTIGKTKSIWFFLAKL